MLNIISNRFSLWEKEQLDHCKTRLSSLIFYSEFIFNIGKWANETQDCITGFPVHTVTDTDAFSGRREEMPFYSSFNHIQVVVNHLHFQLEIAEGVLH